MIAAKRSICVDVNIRAESLPQFLKMIAEIRKDFVTVIKHYEKESTDEVKVELIDLERCAGCGKVYTECRCGTPHRSPLV